ncbi:hypothetical protein ACCAA_10081 [Candidatus Accumulibacter aalborgensis]|uniref:Transposase n=1 Tax=Candidatus Accumulibacter aalborgensis TaxID=1860102 RepID=A0A1A8XD41_9PROT|nr:hypothetical protein ACCAA_10081 [Candidatus Accumulibacter aalborgensis]
MGGALAKAIVYSLRRWLACVWLTDTLEKLPSWPNSRHRRVVASQTIRVIVRTQRWVR